MFVPQPLQQSGCHLDGGERVPADTSDTLRDCY